jgi:hypothetical protein
MEDKFFLHRIRKDGDTFSAGIEVHDTLDSAIQSFHSQMKMAYNNPSYPNMKYVSCMVTDGNDEVVPGFNETWGAKNIQNFFVHYIRKDGDTYTKGIDVKNDYAEACRAYHTYLEYGYGNSRFPNITMVANKITGNSGYAHKTEAWSKNNIEE